MVKLNGKYYMIDATWDDQYKDTLGIRTRYFLKSESWFNSSRGGHQASDYANIDNTLSPTLADDTTYDGCFWNGMYSYILFIDGKIYGTDNDGKIVKYSCDGTTITKEKVLVDLSNTRWQIKTASGYYKEFFALRIASYGDKIYYNLPEKIMEYDINTGISTEVYALTDEEKETKSIYGLYVSDEGELSYLLADGISNAEIDAGITKTVPEHYEAEFDWDEDLSKATVKVINRPVYKVVEEFQNIESTVDSTPATCEEAGSNSYKVAVEYAGNNYEDTKTVEIPALGHDYGKLIAEVPATCTKDGTKAHYECSVCHKLFEKSGNDYVEKTADELNIKAAGHNVVTDAAVPATCTEPGLTEGSHCSKCNQVLVEQEEIPANGHAPVVDDAIAETCTTDGLTEGSHCSVCGEVITKQEVIPRLGHDYTEWEDVYGDQTLFTRGCTRCDIVETEEHRYDDGTVTEEPKCEEPGLMTFTCLDCGRTKTAEIPATGHVPMTDIGVDPKCCEPGLTEGSHCAKCGLVLVEQEEISALGHDMDHQEAVPATLTEAGSRECYHCLRCEKYFEDSEGKTEMIPDDITTYLFANDGLNEYEGEWYYIRDGIQDSEYTGPANGTINGTKAWYYVKNGKVDYDFKDFEKVGSSWMYFSNGKVDKSINADHYGSFWGTIDGKGGWYVVKAGKAYPDYNGFALVGSSWMRYKNGQVDKSYTGTLNVNINGTKKWYYINKGKAILDYTGFGKVGSSWMRFKDGEVNKTVTGIITGTVNGTKAQWYVKAGKVQLDFNGKYKKNGKTYTIKNGKVTSVK